MRYHRHSSLRFRAVQCRWSVYLPMVLTGLLLGVLISILVWVWRELNDPRTMPFREVRIQGQFQHLNLIQLQGLAQRSLSGGFFTLNMDEVRQVFMALPWVEDVSIRRIPGTLIIAVREQQPVARWNDQYLFNSEQQLFLAPRDTPAGLPVLLGPKDQEQTVLANYQQLSAMFKPLNIKVSQLQLNERGSWELTLDNGVLVTIGQDEVLSRVQKLAHWYPQLVGDKAAEVSGIDLRYQNSIAIAWKNH